MIVGLFIPGFLHAADPAPHAIDIPPWFAETFLDFREDLKEVARTDRRAMIYFGQEGCPYCRELMQTNFTQKAIVDKTRRHFLPVALNIWGDRELTRVDGSRMSEKELAKELKVQFTPTLLFLDEKGAPVVRLNGYVPPHRLSAALDYVAGKMEGGQPFAEYMARGEGAGGRQAARRAVLHEAALGPAPQAGRQAAGGGVRDPLLQRLRRTAQGGFPAPRGTGAAAEVRRRPLRALGQGRAHARPGQEDRPLEVSAGPADPEW